MKYCKRGDHYLPRSEFHRDRQKSDGLASNCKACRADRQRIAMSDPARRQAQTARTNRWRAQNPDRALELSRAAHAREHPLYGRIVTQARNARALGNPVENFDADDLLSYWQGNGIDPNRCYYTGEELGEAFHLDHMTPLSRGGAHAVWNLVPCSPAANLDKRDRTAEEYLGAVLQTA